MLHPTPPMSNVDLKDTRLIRVWRLNGESLEVALEAEPKDKVNELVYYGGDVKQCLARQEIQEGTPGKPFSVSCIRLVRGEVQIADEDQVNWEWLKEGSIQYVVLDVMDLDLRQLPSRGDDLLLAYQDPDKLLDPALLIGYACELWTQKGPDFCERIFVRWALAVRNLPAETVNAVPNPIVRKSIMIDRCFALFQALDEPEDLMAQTAHVNHWPSDSPFEDFLHRWFAEVTKDLLGRMDDEVFKGHFHRIPREQLRSHIWKLAQGDPCVCNRRWCFRGGLRLGLGAELVMLLIDKGLPRWCWAVGPNNETLLQSVIAAVAAEPLDWKPQEKAKAELCKFLTKQYTLEELCHQDRDRRTAIWHAAHYCQLCPDDPTWMDVRNAISQRMTEQLGNFQGSLLKLVDLARSVNSSFHGSSTWDPILWEFEQQKGRQAETTRREWLRMGWRFHHDRPDDQISEVLDWHCKAVGQGIVEWNISI